MARSLFAFSTLLRSPDASLLNLHVAPRADPLTDTDSQKAATSPMLIAP